MAYTGEGRQTSCPVQHSEETPTSRGQVCVEGVGLYERHHRHHPVGTLTHETAAAVSDKASGPCPHYLFLTESS